MLTWSIEIFPIGVHLTLLRFSPQIMLNLRQGLDRHQLILSLQTSLLPSLMMKIKILFSMKALCLSRKKLTKLNSLRANTKRKKCPKYFISNQSLSYLKTLTSKGSSERKFWKIFNKHHHTHSSHCLAKSSRSRWLSLSVIKPTHLRWESCWVNTTRGSSTRFSISVTNFWIGGHIMLWDLEILIL
jgi:hypothetical protein